MHSETLRCGLLGRTLGHSYSPAIHAQLAGYSYLLYEKEPEELEGFLRSGEFDGLNVTIPYKKTVIPYCAELSDTARAIGAVNTIVRRPDGTLWGGNTDAYGFSMLVQSSGAEELYRRRKPLYEKFADAMIDNDRTVEDAVRQILEVLG